MGRVRQSMKRLESNSNRQATYCKRRCGILKKAQEISVLCDIDIILLLFSPTGKPTLFQGGPSYFDEIIAKFARLTPQERAKSDPSVEELQSQVKVVQSRLSDLEMRLNWWSNPDKINKVKDLALMECALRESLNAVHIRKLQNTTHLHLLMNSEVDGQTHPWHPENKILHMPFPQTPNILPQEHMGYSGDNSVAECSHVLDSGKVDQARQATTAMLDNSVLNDLNSIACLRQQLSEQYSYNPNDNLDLLERKIVDPQSDANFQGYLMDYEFQRNFNLTRSVDSVNYSAADAVAVPDFDEKSYAQVISPVSILG
ncbi:hypothetical protein R3W88_009846 [Solanum pinnatisectum]|uniref:MADS-box domain-containing protein n=1 Tax=Solanum pinnatisectum TaxID=50273 RepID=A0AAV9MET9_9SOLN|nr:hypothetical protein R3W88_009846 [Solanum pinnatisectum]